MLNIKFDRRQLDKLMSFNGHAGKTLAKGVRRLMLLAAREIVLQIKPGKSIDPHSGQLAKSWQIERGGTAETTERHTVSTAFGRLASKLVYAAIQQFGGIVRAVKSKYLSIPLDPAKTPSGVSKFKSPRQVKDLVAIRSKGGNLLLFKIPELKAAGKGSMPKPWYLLKEEVRLKPTHYVTKAAAETEKQSPAVMGAAIQQDLDKLTSGAA